jgi:hypothetical protein
MNTKINPVLAIGIIIIVTALVSGEILLSEFKQNNGNVSDQYAKPGPQVNLEKAAENPKGNIIGNDRDEHGCLGSGGYAWCEEKQKCLRSWEEKCVNTFWKSEPQGDFVRDTRNPEDVCRGIQKRDSLTSCKLLNAKASRDDKECVGGMSPAGCFACKFQCVQK